MKLYDLDTLAITVKEHCINMNRDAKYVRYRYIGELSMNILNSIIFNQYAYAYISYTA